MIRIRNYEDHLYYPFFVDGKFVEVLGKDIREEYLSEEINITRRDLIYFNKHRFFNI